MPSPYIVRNFTTGTYHIYNKSVDSHLFQDEDDYKTFLFYIYVYLKPLRQVLKTYSSLPFRLQIKNMSSQIDAFAYCLLPNHFHLLIRQSEKDAIPRFMKQLNNAYTEYYNKKYHRRGRLMHGRYRAAYVESDDQILELSRVIHSHPALDTDVRPEAYTFSSFKEYLDDTHDSFINKRLIRSYFSSPERYQQFVLNEYELLTSARIKPLLIEKQLLRG